MKLKTLAYLGKTTNGEVRFKVKYIIMTISESGKP